MKFCENHWAQLLKALDDKGLGALIPDNGEQALRQMIDRDIEGGVTTVDNFDPLMMAHNAILNRATELLPEAYAINPLVLFTEQDDRFICPLCALNNAHVMHKQECTQPGCNYPDEHDWAPEMIGGSTDFIVTKWKELHE